MPSRNGLEYWPFSPAPHGIDFVLRPQALGIYPRLTHRDPVRRSTVPVPLPFLQRSRWRFLVLLPLLGACTGEASDHSNNKVLVIGWDGAGFELIDPLLASGRLPNLARLVSEGRTAQLESTRIPISSAAWTSAFSGVGPGHTGVFGFFEPLEDSSDVQLISSRSNHAPPIWRILSSRGVGVHVFGVPVTWPAEPVQGVMVTGMLAPHEGGFALPEAYEQRLLQMGFVPDLGVWRSNFLPDAERVQEQLAIKEKALVELLGQDNWRCAVAVFKSLDVISHQRYSANLEGPVAQLLVDLDRTLGSLIQAAGPNTDVLVVSDHGFRRYPRTLDLEAFLIQNDWTQRNPGAAPERRQAGPLALARPSAHRARMTRLDLDASRALAMECEGNFGSLRLNVIGRNAQGCVQPSQVPELLGKLEQDLRDLEIDGKKVVTQVWRATELMPGSKRLALPDLVFETVPDLRVVLGSGDILHARLPAGFPDHGLNGIAIMAGPSIAGQNQRASWSITDLGPTILHLLGQPLYREFSGSHHGEILHNPRPPKVIPMDQDPTLRSRSQVDAGSSRSNQEMQDLMRALESMGYAGSEGDQETQGEGDQ